MTLLFAKYSWKNYSFLLLLLGVLSSCTPALYAPNEAYMMGVSKKGDLKIGGSFIGGTAADGLFDASRNQVKQYSGQVAYSPINKFAVVGSFLKLSGQKKDSPVNWDAQNAEIAIGYYHKSGKDNPEDKSYILTDLYAGKGWGNTNSIFSTAGEAHLKYQRLFLHSGVQFWWKNNIAIGFGLRYVNLGFKEANLYGPIPTNYQTGIDVINDRKSHNLVESSFSFQAGNQYLKFFTQITGTFFRTPTYLRTRMAYPSSSIGLIFSLDEIYRSKDKKNIW